MPIMKAIVELPDVWQNIAADRLEEIVRQRFMVAFLTKMQDVLEAEDRRILYGDMSDLPLGLISPVDYK